MSSVSDLASRSGMTSGRAAAHRPWAKTQTDTPDSSDPAVPSPAVIQLRLTNPKLRRLLDPADPCQAVLKSFFVRATTGQFVVDGHEELMARMSHGFSEPGPAAAGQTRGGLLGDKAR